MSRHLRMAAGALAAASVLLLLPSAAHADEVDPTPGEIGLTVEIAPLPCVGECAGGVLPATGADVPSLLVWLALAVIAAGVTLVTARRIRASPAAARGTTPPAPYYVVSGRRAQHAHDGLPSSPHATALRGDAGDRRID